MRVYWADPDPTRGPEQAKARPFVIVSVDQLNQASLELSLAVPLTRTDFGSALHLPIPAREGEWLRDAGAAPGDLPRRLSRRLGALRPRTMEELLKRCRVLLR
jgi:mRNA-degrading endonuclease toxin of MazEF toxin-antitoxin module